MNHPGLPDAEARFLRHPDAAAEVAGEELLLVHLGEGSTFRLNRTGRLIWAALLDGASPRELAVRIAPQLGTTPVVLEADARALVRELLAAHLLVAAR